MGSIRTHTSITPSQNKSASQSDNSFFHLDEVKSTSTNFQVRRNPIRVIAWGLRDDDYVELRIARIGSLGNRIWTLSDDCCPCPITPGPVVNVDYMPYLKCCSVVHLTANNPIAIIDDAGNYFFEYVGKDSVDIEFYDDLVPAKNRICECD